MDANWQPTQGSDPAAVAAGVDPNAPAPAGGEWRAQLSPEARSRIVNKMYANRAAPPPPPELIRFDSLSPPSNKFVYSLRGWNFVRVFGSIRMETLKKHLPESVPEGLNELQKIAVRFEEKIYTAATNQSDYLRKISLKMLFMETKTQQARGNAQVIPNQNNPGSGCDYAGTAFCHRSGSKRRRVTPVICLSPDREERASIQRNNVVQVTRVHAEVAPKEPIFTCPVCLNKMEQPSTTTCGHIFCEKCIKASIKAQKKCPTCRKNLGMRSYHRVYLPATADQGC